MVSCMKKYLYLAYEKFTDAWVNGGKVPLYKASTYRRLERGGVYTPDENLIDTSTHSIDTFLGFFPSSDNATITIGTFMTPKVNITNAVINRRTEDGLVLCLANRRSNYIAKKLKKEACVEILDVAELKNVLDEQIGKKGVMGNCAYTESHKRNHFLKSSLDSWQEEYRIFWKDADSIEVEIPKNLARRISIRGKP